MDATKPWLKFYGDVPRHIDYPRVTVYQALMKTVKRDPDAVAWEFLGTRCTYGKFGDTGKENSQGRWRNQHGQAAHADNRAHRHKGAVAAFPHFR